MINASQHTFHIPVMGLGYTIDSPVKVARFGISSVISIIEDDMIEKMREYYSKESGEEYHFISTSEEDYRAKRLKAYLNLVNKLVNNQVEELREEAFDPKSELTKYFELLPENSSAKELYWQMLEMEEGQAKIEKQNELRKLVKAGSIDVNIMAKVDRNSYTKSGEVVPGEFSDALSGLRGFATSDLHSAVVFSAGYNPRLYNYIEHFSDFFPDENGYLKKEVVLKVSDYRSALTQGKLLAKKGIWVSEFRIESGLNCGGHAFATDGLLLGPILEEFKQNRESLINELFGICTKALEVKGVRSFSKPAAMRITVQGGIGTANENSFFLNYYNLDATGWGSPFLLVPEATSVDSQTLTELSIAKKEDYYLSEASPLGIPFNNFRRSSGEKQRLERIEKGRPGSPCYKKFLAVNTEFTEVPICTASRQYLNLKIKQLEEQNLPADFHKAQLDGMLEKDCLCEGLSSSVLLSHEIKPSHNMKAVTICPGPNLAYFSGIFSLKEMVDHIYGRSNILNDVKRSNVFVNELVMYVDYFKKELEKNMDELSAKKEKYLLTFQSNLLKGINYYKELLPSLQSEARRYREEMKAELEGFETVLKNLAVPSALVS